MLDNNNVVNKKSLESFLFSKNFTNSLINLYYDKLINSISYKYVIIDNSKSMSIDDGHKLITKNGKYK